LAGETTWGPEKLRARWREIICSTKKKNGRKGEVDKTVKENSQDRQKVGAKAHGKEKSEPGKGGGKENRIEPGGCRLLTRKYEG